MSKSLGLILLRAGIITPADLIDAHNSHRDEPLASRLVALGVTTEEQITQALAAQLHIPNVRLGGAMIEPCALQLVSREIAERHEVCPYLLDGEHLHLVMANPLDLAAVEAVERSGGVRVRPAVSTPSDIREAIARTYDGRAGDAAHRLVVEAITAARAMNLSPERELLSLARLGFEPDQLKTLRAALEEPQGMILVSGPRGSGRTGTLYSALSALRCPGIRIVSVEERIEARIKGVEQREIDTWAGETMAGELAPAIEENPDVVMIGELADRPAGTTALESARRGQLVIAGVHAADAVSTLRKLIELGLDTERLAASLTVIVAQRLVRRLCPRCREAYQPGHEVAVCLGLTSGSRAFRAKGCIRCDGSGYKGQVAIFEVLPVSAALRDLIARGASAAMLAREARRGFASLQQAAAIKVRQGITSPEEVFRVMQLGAEENWQDATSVRDDGTPMVPVVHGAARHAHKRRRMHAFSLVELLVVLTMIGVLGAAALQQYRTWTGRSTAARLEAAARAAAGAQETFFAEHASYASGDCTTLPGFTPADGVVCTTAGDATVFRVSTRSVTGTATCLWTSNPPAGQSPIACRPS